MISTLGLRSSLDFLLLQENRRIVTHRFSTDTTGQNRTCFTSLRRSCWRPCENPSSASPVSSFRLSLSSSSPSSCPCCHCSASTSGPYRCPGGGFCTSSFHRAFRHGGPGRWGRAKVLVASEAAVTTATGRRTAGRRMMKSVRVRRRRWRR